MRTFFFLVLSLGLWVGAVFAWFTYADAQSAMNLLGPDASNAEIYPIENKMLREFFLGPVLSLAAIVTAAFASAKRSG